MRKWLRDNQQPWLRVDEREPPDLSDLSKLPGEREIKRVNAAYVGRVIIPWGAPSSFLISFALSEKNSALERIQFRSRSYH